MPGFRRRDQAQRRRERTFGVELPGHGDVERFPRRDHCGQRAGVFQPGQAEIHGASVGIGHLDEVEESGVAGGGGGGRNDK